MINTTDIRIIVSKVSQECLGKGSPSDLIKSLSSQRHKDLHDVVEKQKRDINGFCWGVAKKTFDKHGENYNEILLSHEIKTALYNIGVNIPDDGIDSYNNDRLSEHLMGFTEPTRTLIRDHISQSWKMLENNIGKTSIDLDKFFAKYSDFSDSDMENIILNPDLSKTTKIEQLLNSYTVALITTALGVSRQRVVNTRKKLQKP